MALVWMHNGLLKRDTAGKIGGRNDRDDAAGQAAPEATPDLDQIQQQVAEKEARSGGAGGLAEMIAKFGGERIRFFLLRTHYRSTVVYSDEALTEASSALEAFYRFFQRYERITGGSFYELPAPDRQHGALADTAAPVLAAAAAHRSKFLERMDDDFNTGAAISELFELLRALNKHIDAAQLEDAANRSPQAVQALSRATATLRELSAVLGLFRAPPVEDAAANDTLLNGLMELVIEIRNESRAKKDFATADKIRDKLNELKITLEDRKDGTGWRVD
jgi:cysteinyl-tRNA synthetase